MDAYTKQYSIFHIPVLSFFSKDLYRDVGMHWKGVNFLYLLLLLAVCLLPTTIKMYIGFANFVNNEAPAVIEQVPQITIDNGKVSINEPQPYYIKDPEKGDILAIIDTTGKITSLEDIDALCLLTDNKLIFKKNKFENRTYELSSVETFVVDSERITGWLHIFRKYLFIVYYPLVLLGSYLFRIVQALIYAAIGLLFASLCKVALSYPTLLRLSIVAMTPCLLAKTILSITGNPMPCLISLICLIITLAYLYFAVKANSVTIPASQEANRIEGMTIE